jgi:phosphoglycolate phosphatase (TIGR01487 family)
MMENGIRALVTDIDGSITDPTRKISLVAATALRILEERGITVILASGNVLPIAYGLAAFIGCSGPVIAENGGIIYYQREVKLLGDRKKCDEAFEDLKKHLPARKIFSDRWRQAELAIEPDVDLAEVRRLIAPFGLLAETTGFAYHIFEPSVSKFKGLLVACDMLGIKIEDVAAFGDSENDIEMVKNCGVGLAPANALPELKSIADFVAEKPNGQGLIEGLKWLKILN